MTQSWSIMSVVMSEDKDLLVSLTVGDVFGFIALIKNTLI